MGLFYFIVLILPLQVILFFNIFDLNPQKVNLFINKYNYFVMIKIGLKNNQFKMSAKTDE